MNDKNDETQIAPPSSSKICDDPTVVNVQQSSQHNDSSLSPTVVSSAATPAESPLTSSANIIRIGSILNQRFVLDELLGSGGMGVVYRALDKRKQETQDRNPYVAIKILGEEFGRHPSAFIALQRECSKSQALAHPNIITVYDFDRDGDIVYMTMEQLFGSPLDTVIEKNPTGLPFDQARTITARYANFPSLASFAIPVDFAVSTDQLDNAYYTYALGLSAVLRGARANAAGKVSSGIQGFVNYKIIDDLKNYKEQMITGGLRYEF